MGSLILLDIGSFRQMCGINRLVPSFDSRQGPGEAAMPLFRASSQAAMVGSCGAGTLARKSSGSAAIASFVFFGLGRALCQ
jgi:hypothetical protein